MYNSKGFYWTLCFDEGRSNWWRNVGKIFSFLSVIAVSNLGDVHCS
jgi:hypothetical protein